MNEREKYELIWEFPEYRIGDGGARYLPLFLSLSSIKKGQSVIEFGCGEGKISFKLEKMGYCVTPIDIADNCLTTSIATHFRGRFIRKDFTEGIDTTADFGFSADTLEHIPPDRIDAAIQVILNSCGKCYLHICTTPDGCGGKIGETLHLSVHNYKWWRDKFLEHDAEIYMSKKKHNYVIFYVGLK